MRERAGLQEGCDTYMYNTVSSYQLRNVITYSTQLHSLQLYTMRYAVLVTGPAGAGKSTFCAALITHAQTLGRTVHLVNLDPAAERFEYEPAIDIRDLINLEDVMEELEFGPNGGLIYCFECVIASTS
jgi:GTPase SAR1 family protein